MKLTSAIATILVASIPSAFAFPMHQTSNEESKEESKPTPRSLDETLATTIDTLEVEADGSVSSGKMQIFQVVDEVNDEFSNSVTGIIKKAKTTKEPKITKDTKQPKTGTKTPKLSKCTIKMPKLPKGSTHPPGESEYALMRVSLEGSSDCSEVQSFFENNLCMDFNVVECSSSGSESSRSLESTSVLLQIFDATAESLSEYIEKNEKSLNKLWMEKLNIDKGSKESKGGADSQLLSIDDIFSTMIPSNEPSSLPSNLPSLLPSSEPSDIPSGE